MQLVKHLRVYIQVAPLLLLMVSLGQVKVLSQTPACAMEIWTEQEEYILRQEVKVYAWIKVGDQDILGAHLYIQVRPPYGATFDIKIKSVDLPKGLEFRGFLMTLPQMGEQFGLLALGLYELRASLEDPESKKIYCEARTTFILKSGWGQKQLYKTLILTSRQTQQTLPFVSKLAVWLEAAYRTSVQVIYQDELFLSYKKGLYKDFDVLIYYGLDFDQPPPPAYLEDVFSGEEVAKKKVVWIGYHLDKIPSSFIENIGFTYSELRKDDKPSSLIYLYSNTAYELVNPDRIYVQISNNELARAHATVDDKVILASSRHKGQPAGPDYFYFIGFHPTAFLKPFGAHLVFLDVLNEIYGVNRDKTALIRIEDVQAKMNASFLLAATAFLKSEGIPFSLAVIPIYVKGAELIRLSENQDFRMLIKNALLNGGELIIHGATHQFDGETAMDYEFWDEKADKPINGAGYAQRRVALALKEILLSGLVLHTVGWETPHYKASEEHYAVFEDYFGLLYEDPQAFDLALLPYPVESSKSTYVPANLGFIAAQTADADVQLILKEAQLLSGLKYGALASFSFHPSADLERLKVIVAALKSQGWTFKPVSSLVEAVRVKFPKEDLSYQ